MALTQNQIWVVGPRTDLLLETFQGREALGVPYRYDLTLLSDAHNIPVTDLLGKPLTVCIDVTPKTSPEHRLRYFDGIVTYFAKVGGTIRHTRYSVVLSPTLSRLDYAHNCRIFNDASNADADPEGKKATQDTLTIVKKVLAKRDVTLVDDATKNQHVGCDRRYCVQYRETDLNFIQRLLEEEGIYYYFRHEENKHTLVLVDSSAAHPKVEGYHPVIYRPKQNKHLLQQEHFWSLSVAGSLYPGKYSVLRGYDYTQLRPQQGQIEEQFTGVEQPGAKFEVYDYPGGLIEKEQAQHDALIRMQTDQGANTTIEVEGNTVGLGVGNLVTLTRADEVLHSPFWTEIDFNKEYLITEATYSISLNIAETGDAGVSDEPFKARYTLLDTEIQFRPKRTAPKPRIEGPQTAIVVGSAKDEDDDEDDEQAGNADGQKDQGKEDKGGDKKEEIYTDKLGRVKVKFDWDRSRRRNQRASCWVRVAQIWAGQNWGAIHIPRVGQEVIVEFLDGDPDRPIITGRVYNTDNMPPYTLPDHRTQSGIKSRSANAGTANNFNEIRFEDLKGKEELHLQAEKNMSTLVKNSQSTSVGADRSVSVGGNQSTTVTKNETQTYQANRTMDVTGTNSDTTHKEYTGIYCQGRNNGVDGKDDVLIVTQNKSVAVTGTYSMSSQDTCTICHGKEAPGDAEIIIDEDAIELTNESKSTVFINGGAITINAPETIDLMCGSAAISMSKDGTITITGKAKVALSGGESSKVTLDPAGAAVEGKLVKINS